MTPHEQASQPLHLAILNARDSLNETNWLKWKYFCTKENALCMCAHGALQNQVNPAVIEATRSSEGEVAVEAAEIAAAAGEADAPAAAAVVAWWQRKHASAGAIFKDRPLWVKAKSDTYGCLDAHFVLGMVGLTASFNDHPDTTLEMVKDKFTQAAELAKELTGWVEPVAKEQKNVRTYGPNTKRYWAKLFRDTAKLLESGSITHVQGTMLSYYGDNECRCAIGAMAKVAGRDGAFYSVFGALPEYAQQAFRDATNSHNHIIAYNDNELESEWSDAVGCHVVTKDGTKKLCWVLRRAAALLEHGGRPKSPKGSDSNPPKKVSQ